MLVIKSIIIKYFRSIYSLNLENCKDLTVITGLNDVGKSNVLKALNLYFNKQTDWLTNHKFSADYSLVRREAVKKSIREQQYISIAIQFVRGDRSINTLPPLFTVTRRWDLYSTSGDYKQTTDIHRHMKSYCAKNELNYSEAKTTASLNRFLNSIQYIYIPAIKDRTVFSTVLHMLQTSILSGKKRQALSTPIRAANDALAEELDVLQHDFEKATGISSTIAIPESFNFTQDMLDIDTQIPDGNISIDYRGDGIKAHYIPKMLDYISKKSPSKMWIWGFEEPENSYEYRRCLAVAREFEKTYCQNNQVFLTTHSPAFYYDYNADKKAVVRLCSQDNKTNLYTDNDSIDSELGYIELYRNFAEKVEALEQERNLILDEIADLQQSLREFQTPLLLTEGKTDAQLVKKAFAKLELSEFSEWEIRAILSGNTSNNEVLLRFLNDLKANGTHNNRMVIGMFDRDTPIEISVGGLKHSLISEPFIKMGNRIYAFAIPVPHNRPQAHEISIEHYFTDSEIKSEQDSKRLFLGSEFEKTGVYKGDAEFHYKAASKVYSSIRIIEHESNCYVTDHRGNGNYSISKTIFADNVCNDVEGFNNFSFEEFHKIAAILREIWNDSIAEIR